MRSIEAIVKTGCGRAIDSGRTKSRMSGAKTYLARTWSGVLLFAIQSQHFLLFAGRLHFSAAAFFLQHSGTGEQLAAFRCAQQTWAAHSETQTPLAMLEAVRESVKTKLMSSLI